MHRILVVLVVLLLVPAVAFARQAAGPPGGAAPKSLAGTLGHHVDPGGCPQAGPWREPQDLELVIINGKYLSYPRALGLRPVGVKGDTVPFAISGRNLLVSCLNDLGIATAGYGVYSWTISGKTLQFKLIKEPCNDQVLRDRIVILTTHPWHRTG